jgi:3-oxoadipate enol-lactonase
MIAGNYDVATPVEGAKYIQAHIPGAALTLLDAGHISNVEQADGFTAAVLSFLT